MDAAAFRQSFEDLRNGPRFVAGATSAPMPAPMPGQMPAYYPVPQIVGGAADGQQPKVDWTLIIVGAVALGVVVYLIYKEFYNAETEEESPKRPKRAAGRPARRVKFDDEDDPDDEEQQMQFQQQMMIAQQQARMRQQQQQQPQGVGGQIQMIQAAMEKAKQEAAVRLQESLDSNEDGIPMPGAAMRYAAAAPTPNDFEPV
jgi:uncharacterized protein HemX